MLGIIVWFIRHAPGVWTLRDILLIMRDEEIIRAILASDKETRHYLKPLADSKVAANIGATISTKLVAYEPIAACWHKADSSFSLHDDWLDSGSVLILGESSSPLLSPSERSIRSFLPVQPSCCWINRSRLSNRGMVPPPTSCWMKHRLWAS